MIIIEDELTFAEKIEIVEKIFLAHFTFWVAETIYDYKSQAPQFAYDCQSMALGEDQSTPRAYATAFGLRSGTRS